MKNVDSGIKLSIIIPFYKTYELTCLLMDNLSKQVGSQSEIILIDDGCNDERLDLYDKKPNVFVIHKNNTGVSASRNVGLKHAKGKYVAFIDSDDNVSENYISAIIKKINEAEFDYCFFSWKMTNKRHDDVIINDKPPGWNTSIWNCIYKRSSIGMFNENMQIAEDELFNKMYRKGEKEIINEILYYYNVGRNDSLTQRYSKKEISKDRPIKASLILFQKFVSEIGGLETFIYEFLKAYHDVYDIIFVYRESDPKQLRRYSKLVKCLKFNNQRFECDKYLCVSNQDNIADNVVSTENWYGMMIHADYAAMKWAYKSHKKTTINIAVSKIAKQGILKQCPNLPCEVIYNLQETPETIKPLVLISATRLSWEKGEDKMYQLEDKLCEAGIPHIWMVFTDHPKNWYKNMAFVKGNLEVEHYIKMADYYITCSQTESWGYSTDLALKLGVPVVATYYPALDEQGVVDGDNGYILKQDLSNVDDVVNKMINKRLKDNFSYNPKDSKQQWIDFLGELKEPNNEWRDYNMKYLVKATFAFDDASVSDEKGAMIKRTPAGEGWIVDEDRKDYLLSKNAVKIMQEIPTEIKIELNSREIAKGVIEVIKLAKTTEKNKKIVKKATSKSKKK